jgi:hypothetical protein
MTTYRRNRLASIFPIACFAAFLAGPTAQNAAAQIGAGDFEAGFDVGATRIDKELTGDNGADLRVDARAGRFATDRFEIELQAARANAALDATLDSVLANGVFNFPISGTVVVVPYVLVGIGNAHLDAGGLFEGDVTGSGLAYQAAVGSRFFFGRDSRMGARVELSTLFEDALDETHQHTSLTAGLLWRIGR